MSLLSSNLFENLNRSYRGVDQNFGAIISPEILFSNGLLHRNKPLLKMFHRPTCCRPWNELMRAGEGDAWIVKSDKDQFRVDLDVQQFSPEEINVKVIDRFVIVEGKHEERQDEHGWISRQFSRRYSIPEQCDIDQVASKLSSDGVLSIVVPRKQKSVAEGERVIYIEQTGKPAVHHDTQKVEKEAKEEEAE